MPREMEIRFVEDDFFYITQQYIDGEWIAVPVITSVKESEVENKIDSASKEREQLVHDVCRMYGYRVDEVEKMSLSWMKALVAQWLERRKT